MRRSDEPLPARGRGADGPAAEESPVEAVRPRSTRDQAPTDAERASRLLLPRVSRTFALGINMLPPRLEAPVRIGYLLCRIADTIEDDLAVSPERKAQLLDEFLACFDDGRGADEFALCIAELTAND